MPKKGPGKPIGQTLSAKKARHTRILLRDPKFAFFVCLAGFWAIWGLFFCVFCVPCGVLGDFGAVFCVFCVPGGVLGHFGAVFCFLRSWWGLAILQTLFAKKVLRTPIPLRDPKFVFFCVPGGVWAILGLFFAFFVFLAGVWEVFRKLVGIHVKMRRHFYLVRFL